MKKFHTSAIAAAVLAMTTLSTGAVLAQTQPCPQTDLQARISWSQLTKQLEDKGYTIREIEFKADGWEADVMDQNHSQVELRLNPQGTIVHQRFDH